MTYIPPVLAADPAPRDARLTLAMAEGLVLPDGLVTVLRPRAAERFDPLDMSRLQVAQGFRPDHDALLAAGYDVAVAARPAPTVLVCLPRSKAEAFSLIAQAAGALGLNWCWWTGRKLTGLIRCSRRCAPALMWLAWCPKRMESCSGLTRAAWT